jgi:hypothetical protein
VTWLSRRPLAKNFGVAWAEAKWMGGLSDLEATFAAPDFYAKPRAEIFDLETQLKTARDKVAHLYARWHELELIQSIASPNSSMHK